MEEKNCTKCKRLLPSDSFRIRQDGNCFYLEPKCRECERQDAAEYRSRPGYYEHRKVYKRSKATDIKFHVQEKISSWRAKSENSDLDTEYLVKLYNDQNGLCYYTDTKMIVGGDRNKELNNFLSLDKLNPDQGYIKGNVVWCLYLVNTMKQNMTEQQFYLFIENIVQIKNGRQGFRV